VKTALIYSGGLDSTVLLYLLRKEGPVHALGIDYGQRHVRELLAARDICARVDVPFVKVDLSGLAVLWPGSSQTDRSVEVPEGHYAEESMKRTVVPNRNMTMLAVAAGYALAHGLDTVAYAAHAGDHAIYPDCRPLFVQRLRDALDACDWKPLALLVPFLHKTKAQLVSLGHHLGVPFGTTWTCYKGLQKHCGRCGSCTERREAFVEAKVPDPTEYDV
jgi:7-cyano-7-deazaguanine synthase